MEMVWELITSAVRLHRSWLIVATIILAIAASRVAVAPKLGTWLIIVGAAVLMYVSDVLRGVEEDAAELARSTSHDRKVALRDVFSAHGPVRICLAIVLGCSLIVAGFIVGA
jgi:hypothetical protein